MTNLVLYDEKAEGRAVLFVAGDGEVGLGLDDSEGKNRAFLKVSKEGSPSLSLYDKDEKNRVELSVSKEGSSSLDLYDKDRKLRAVLGSISLEMIRTGAVEKTAPSSLVFFDKEGKVIFKAP